MDLSRSGIRKVLLFFFIPLTVFCQNQYTITTQLGDIKGLEHQYGNSKVYQFLKIPYAKPPIGNLRFSKPEPYGSWNTLLDGTVFSSSCVQIIGIEDPALQDQSEDCLFLNVYIPYNVSSANRKSVMIWIHGGGFQGGSGKLYDGSDLAITGDVIVVTINYRLNIYGFISSGDSVLPGNYGLWDQRLAIKWVKDNIADFGGNPSMITIFGESAGAWSVSFQSLCPLNAGLFHKAILQSGTANSIMPNLKSENLSPYARKAGCMNATETDKAKVVECMKQKTTTEISQIYIEVEYETTTLHPKIGAIVDGEFLPDEPSKLLKNMSSESSKFFRSLDVIIGTTSGEGSLLIYDVALFGIDTTNGMTTKFLCEMFGPALARDFFRGVTMVSEAMCNKYKVENGDTTMMEEQGRQLTNLYGDLFFLSPATELLNLHSNSNPLRNTFQYLFDRDHFKLPFIPDWFQGAHHTAELPYLFSAYKLQPNDSFTPEDRQLSQTLLKYWTNFAKTGNPNDGLTLPVWPEYDELCGKYIRLDIEIRSGTHLLSNRMHFWLNEVPNILNPLIQSSSGSVRGTAVQYPQGTVSQFLGIPYAKPPIGTLRFEKPQPVDTWTNTLDAFNHPSSCIQDMTPETLAFLPNKEISEDCLYLNIYVPGNISDSNKKSVMVWIHGGGFASGQASFYDGSILATTGDVIVVCINYRLGVFGFLSSNDSVIRGNYGLWDQKLAIEWVKENIAKFCGNPSSITIFGESAGGFSVSLQSLVPSNKGLFQRVISQSGTALTNLAVSESPRNSAVLFANEVNCSNSSTTVILHCLRNISPSILQSATSAAQQSYNRLHSLPPANFDYLLKPAVDGEVIPDVPRKLLTDSSSESYKFFRSLDIIVGTTSAEGSILLPFLPVSGIEMKNGTNSSALCDILAPAMAFGKDNMAYVSQQICNMYRVNGNSPSALIDQARKIVDLFGDAFFVSDAVETLNLHSVNNHLGNSYQYLFSKQLPLSLEFFPVPDWFLGSSHGSELFYLFGPYPFLAQGQNIPVLPEDLQLIDNMIMYWSNFAKTGNPNSNGLTGWSQFTNKEKKYVDLGSDSTARVKAMLWSDRMNFWFRLKNLKYILDEPEKRPTGVASVQQSTVSLLVTACLLILRQAYE